jgi:hypothetical protein
MAMITVEILKEWLDALPNDTWIGIDDGGLAIQTEDGQAYIEVGGLEADDVD